MWQDHKIESDYSVPDMMFRKIADLPPVGSEILLISDKNLDPHVRWFNHCLKKDNPDWSPATPLITITKVRFTGLDEEGWPMFHNGTRFETNIDCVIGYYQIPTATQIHRNTEYGPLLYPESTIEKIDWETET